MATLSEHKDSILAAIEAARKDGFEVAFDYQFDYYGDAIESIQLCIMDDEQNWDNILVAELG